MLDLTNFGVKHAATWMLIQREALYICVKEKYILTDLLRLFHIECLLASEVSTSERPCEG